MVLECPAAQQSTKGRKKKNGNAGVAFCYLLFVFAASCVLPPGRAPT
jgi:hypothetical protein